MASLHHAKSDSDMTTTMSMDQSTPPRSPRRPLYYVQSPSNQDHLDKMSYGSSPEHPNHHHFYHCSPIHHSRESSATRFSASLKLPGPLSSWKKIHRHDHGGADHDDDADDHDDDDDDDEREDLFGRMRLYFCFAFGFFALFSMFSLILWASSFSFKPQISVQNIEFRRFNIQAGNDRTGVPTDMLTLNSTVRILYRNPATFFGVHVSSSPFVLRYKDLKVASGEMTKFYQERKSHRTVLTMVLGHQVPLYGGVTVTRSVKDNADSVVVPLNLSFEVRSRAYILGKLVKSKFYRRVRCSVVLKGNKLGKAFKLLNSCTYH